MSEFKALPHVVYRIHDDDPASDKPASEQQHLRILAALDHLLDLAHLLEYLETKTTDEKSDRLFSSIHTIGELQVTLLASIYTELDVEPFASKEVDDVNS